jgi:hypothetical protein
LVRDTLIPVKAGPAARFFHRAAVPGAAAAHIAVRTRVGHVTASSGHVVVIKK